MRKIYAVLVSFVQQVIKKLKLFNNYYIKYILIYYLFHVIGLEFLQWQAHINEVLNKRALLTRWLGQIWSNIICDYTIYLNMIADIHICWRVHEHMEDYIVNFGCFNILVMLIPLLKAYYPSLVPCICSMTKDVERVDILLMQKKREK